SPASRSGPESAGTRSAACAGTTGTSRGAPGAGLSIPCGAQDLAYLALQDVTTEVLVFDDAGDLLLDVFACDEQDLLSGPLVVGAFVQHRKVGLLRVSLRIVSGRRRLHKVRRMETDLVEHLFHDGVQAACADVFRIL